MSLDLLDTPVRITWDLHGPQGHLSREDALRVAARLIEGGVFFVTLDEQPLLHPDFDEILSALTEGGCQVQVYCSGSAEEMTLFADTPRPLQSLLLDLAGFLVDVSLDEERLRAIVDSLRGMGQEPAFALIPQRKNLMLIPRLVALCRELGIARFKLPNAKLDDTFRSSQTEGLPRWQDLEVFRRDWQASGLQDLEFPALEIHDLFLWEIMTPGRQQARSEYGGCQAGNSLGHVAADGTLFPCAAWPQPLGSLLVSDLADLWQSSQRQTVREQAGHCPSGCEDCGLYPVCLGGCRGLACFLNSDQGERDLMCCGPRAEKK